MKKLKVGDKVLVTGDSGFCDPFNEIIKKVLTKYDENTGKPYPVYVTDSGQQFDGRHGYAITGASAYYINELVNPPSKKKPTDKKNMTELEKVLEGLIDEKE